MVSTTSILSMVISLLIAFGLPIGLAIYICVKRKASLQAVLIGALIFLVFQLLTRIPLLQVLGKMAWYRAMASNLGLIALFLSLTAGLFEETGRLVAFRFLLRNKLDTQNALAYGIGHGGFESISLVGLTFINNLVYSLMINSGTFDQTIAPALGNAASGIKNQLISLPPVTWSLAGLERIFTIIVQIALSLLVYYAVRYRKPVFYWAAILAHTLVNFPAVILAALKVNIFIPELYILLVAVLGLVLILKTRSVEARLAGVPAEQN